MKICSLVSVWGNIERALLAGDYAGAQHQSGRVRKSGTATSTSVRIGG